jgi:ABC-type transport system substrate-binding protein
MIATRLNPDFAPYKLEAAETVELVDDVTVRMTLKPDQVYDNQAPVNGRPVVAEDIAIAQQAYKDNPAATNSFQVVYMDSVEATDERTVVWHLTQPNAYIFSGTQMGEQSTQMIVPPEILEMDLASTKPVGSGPYKLKEWTLGSDYVWERNPTSRFEKDGLPYIDERQYLTIGDASAKQAAFANGQVHVITQTNVTERDTLLDQLGDDMYVISYFALNPFTFNFGGMASFNPLKRDERVRHAAYKTLIRQQFLDLLFRGEGALPPAYLQLPHEAYQVAYSDMTPNGMTVEQIWSQDLAEARKLMEAAGVLDQEWEINPIISNTGLNEQSAQILQTQFAEIGFKIKIIPLPGAELLPKAASGEWYMFTGGHPAYDSPQTPTRQQHSVSRNEFGWTGAEDPEIDALIEKSEIATDREENIRLVKEVQLLCLSKWAPYIQLVTRNQDNLLRKEVKDWDIEPATSVYYYEKTWLDI